MSSRRDFLSVAWAAAGAGAAVAGVAAVGKALSGSPDESRSVELSAGLLKRAEAEGGLVHEGLFVHGPATAPVVLDLTCTHLRCRVAPIEGGGFSCPCHGSRFALDGTVLPILKDEQGVAQVSLPVGRSRLEVDWELANAAALWLRPPVPSFAAPVGTLWHRIYPGEGRTVIKSGGLDGSPRVALWPSLGACLALAFVLIWLTRWGRTPLSSTALTAVALSGFAILHPTAALPLVAWLGVGRVLSRIKSPRPNARIVLELFVWAALAVLTVSLIFATLQHALFERDPMEVESFVQGGAVPAAAVVGEAVAAFEIARAFVSRFSGATVLEIAQHFQSYRKELKKKFGLH